MRFPKNFSVIQNLNSNMDRIQLFQVEANKRLLTNLNSNMDRIQFYIFSRNVNQCLI